MSIISIMNFIYIYSIPCAFFTGYMLHYGGQHKNITTQHVNKTILWRR